MMRALRGRRGLRRLLAVLVVAGFLPAATGCFGGFHLTRKVHHFNQELSNDRWIQWVAFLVMNIVPVYPFSTVFDAFFANSWEFWSGRNPVLAEAEPPTRVVRGPEGTVLSATRLGPRRFRLEVTRPDGETRRLILVREADAALARDAETGEPLARVRGRDGRPTLAPVR